MVHTTGHGHESPDTDDLGMTPEQIRWIPIVVPLCGLLLALVGAAVLSVA